MSMTPRLPQPLTPQSLVGLMRNPAYWDSKDPQFPTYQRLVKRGFEILYPGPVRRSDTGNMIDTPPLAPHIVAKQVDAVNLEMAAMDEGPTPETGSDKTHDGMIHVESHTRDGGKTEVSDYWRNPPGQGARESASGHGAGERQDSDKEHGDDADKGDPETQNDPGQDTLPGQPGEDDLRSVNPLPDLSEIEIRNDDIGHGNFGDTRTRLDGTVDWHKGIDILGPSGMRVTSPVDGTVLRITDAYPNGLYPEMKAVVIEGDDGNEYKLLYVTSTDKDGNSVVNKGARVNAGDDIGFLQDRASLDKSGRMKNHLHFEIRDKKKNPVDPTPLIERWRKGTH